MQLNGTISVYKIMTINANYFVHSYHYVYEQKSKFKIWVPYENRQKWYGVENKSTVSG